MKKHVWEYFFKDEEELEKHQAHMESFQQGFKNTAIGCLFILLVEAFLLFIIIIILSALHVI